MKLDGRLARAVMAVQAIKGVEIGLGFEAARRRGSQVHDPIEYDATQQDSPNLGYVRPTNNAGGLEAGMTNGQPLVIRAAKKPISTLRKPLASVNLATKEPESAAYEREQHVRVPAAGVILENVVAFEIAGGDGRKVRGRQPVRDACPLGVISTIGEAALVGAVFAPRLAIIVHGENARLDTLTQSGRLRRQTRPTTHHHPPAGLRRTRMFRLRQKTRRGLCRAGFVLLCLLPTAALALWGSWRSCGGVCAGAGKAARPVAGHGKRAWQASNTRGPALRDIAAWNWPIWRPAGRQPVAQWSSCGGR